MAEEKWISASEAKDFGFIDKVYEPTKAAAKISFDGNNKVLPEIPKEIANKIYKQINNSKTMEINEQSIADKVVNGVKEFFNKKEEVAPVETKSEINVDEIVNNAVKAAIDATKTEVESLKAQLAEKETEAINAKANADKAAEDNAKLKANTTKVEAKEDTAENEEVEELAYVNSIKNLIGKLNK